MKYRNYGKGTRGAALEALCRVDKDGSYSSAVLDKAIEERSLSSADKALATRLVYGTLQKRIYLDYCIEQASGRKISKMDTPVLNAMRLGAYQIIFCDKIPNSAAVNEAVDSVKLCGFTSAKGLVNAVLRKLSNEEPILPEGEIERLAVTHSLPVWLVYHLRKSYKTEKLTDILDGFDSEPDIFIRVNTTLTDEDSLIDTLKSEGTEAEKTEVKNALCIKKIPSVKKSEAFKKGLFHVQDLSSQLCALALCPKENDRILDICSAPGGKSFTSAEIVKGKCSILSCDIHPSRVELIKNGASRLKLNCIEAVTSDATVFDPSLGEFDKVLCDVPCSGLGVIRRKPEIRFKDEAELKKYPEIQYAILCNASKYLKQNGRLIYSTCTLNPAENTRIVEKFLSEHKDFAAVPLFDEGDTHKTFFPHRDKTDGFFMAAFTKKGE